MREELKVLFEPIKIGGLTVPNRFVVAPMSSRTASEENTYYDYGNTYFAERIKGGFGIVITEFIAVDPCGLGNVIEPGIWDDHFVPELRKLTDECHKYKGGYIFAQLHHAGATAVSVNGSAVYGPSDRFDDKGNKTATGFTNAEVYELIDKYIKAAVRAKEAGFDGVEVHGAHMYLLYQFMSPAFNQRTDEFGGSYENRFRAVKLIIEGIKKACGEDYPVGLRINYRNGEEGGTTADEYCIYAKMAEEAGADYIHVSHPFVLLPYYWPEGYNRENTRKIKEAVSIPVITVGRINHQDLAADIIRNGDADMVALGRQSVADPHLPNKLLNDEEGLIYHCMSCGQRCHNSSPGCAEWDTGISCMLNPFSGKENRWIITEVPEKKKISVIGAGPAGLQAAWILAKRGHDVTIYEKSDHYGGNFLTGSRTPSKDILAEGLETIHNHCLKYGIKFVYNKTVTKQDLIESDADHIVVAIGAKPKNSGNERLDRIAVFAQDVINGKAQMKGDNVAVIGGASVALETAELLIEQGKKVTVIYRGSEANLGRGMIRVVKGSVLGNLKGKATIMTDTIVTDVNEDGDLLVENNGETKALKGFTDIVIAVGYQADDSLNLDSDKVVYVGDCKAARDAKYAIFEATEIALKL